MLAQTWSEHCKHKIFNANIEYSEKVRKGISALIHKGKGNGEKSDEFKNQPENIQQITLSEIKFIEKRLIEKR